MAECGVDGNVAARMMTPTLAQTTPRRDCLEPKPCIGQREPLNPLDGGTFWCPWNFSQP